jgi:hypothetical protein
MGILVSYVRQAGKARSGHGRTGLSWKKRGWYGKWKGMRGIFLFFLSFAKLYDRLKIYQI